MFADTYGLAFGRRIAVTKLRDDQTGWSREFELKPIKIGVDDEGEDINSAFVDAKTVTAGFGKASGSPKRKPPTQSQTAFLTAFEESLAQFGRAWAFPGIASPAVRASDTKASFARNYRPEGQPGKTADAQRQAFTRAMKAALEEGNIRKGSWEGADWLWREGDSKA